jgi:hypothetical protein
LNKAAEYLSGWNREEDQAKNLALFAEKSIIEISQ